MLRFAEHNEWVFFTMIGCIFALLFMQIILHRYANLREFLLESYQDSSNILPTWLIISSVYITATSTLISQYVPVIPEPVAHWSFFGVSLNKIGFTISILVIFCLLKALLSFLFFASVGHAKTWPKFYFAASKFFFVLSIILIALNFGHYYFVTDPALALNIYLLYFGIIFIFKLFYYIFNKNAILPNQWYYKFLYICTLQIAPIFALWKLLFI